MRNILVFSSLLVISHCLTCYHCIGTDCDTVVTRSTSTIECPVGSFCQTAKFQYFDSDYNQVRATKPARGCSVARGCMNSLNVDSCKSDPQQFMMIGCPTRYCCDTDLCNTIEAKDLL
ncbi:hypothetical protein PRIPAC_92764 [Pristionchus pacificus]|uniref:Uncharacterized protein n=1 Tax=Pristionchus pacificus TaxID=54126 RepID=A0A2A6BQ95_PRIPA|nr:hypothetical protein PRIPAC_92764 [Pristionchus pacificus]|eukprot:PDM67953.1 hypothetical protein PRIPAC_45997 [Pristionchus pacificus]